MVSLSIAPLTDTEVDAAADELVALYAAVGWTAYTKDPRLLVKAVRGSSYAVAARRDGRLVGLARALSDDATICYLQDILVDPAEQRTGLGTALVRAVRERFAGVRQQVLLTDDEPGQRAFYEALGFTEIRDLGAGTIRAFVVFQGGP